MGIYGLIVSVLISSSIKRAAGNVDYYNWDQGFDLASGLCCGFSGLGAGYAIGVVGDEGAKRVAQEPKLYVGMLLVLIFSEAIGAWAVSCGLVAGLTRESCDGSAVWAHRFARVVVGGVTRRFVDRLCGGPSEG